MVIPLLDLNDQVVVAKGLTNVMPPQVFAIIRPLIEKAVVGNWDKLTAIVPELEQKVSKKRYLPKSIST
jgi:hypothetical protein